MWLLENCFLLKGLIQYAFDITYSRKETLQENFAGKYLYIFNENVWIVEKKPKEFPSRQYIPTLNTQLLLMLIIYFFQRAHYEGK